MLKMAFSSKQHAFLAGFGSLFDFTGHKLNAKHFGNQLTDRSALQADWYAISNDIHKASNAVVTEMANTKATRNASK